MNAIVKFMSCEPLESKFKVHIQYGMHTVYSKNI